LAASGSGSSWSLALEWANTRLVTGDAVETLPALKRDSEGPLRTMGSVSLVRNLIDAGLVDRLRLMVFPLTCGSAGSEHISEGARLTRLHLEHTRLLDGRIVLLEYRLSA
jgi:dihydrofolate reductase